MLTEEQHKNFISRTLEIEQELKDYPEKKKELDRELIMLARNYNKAHKSIPKKEYILVQVQEECDIVQVRFSFRKEG
jgi:hypothetical protein